MTYYYYYNYSFYSFFLIFLFFLLILVILFPNYTKKDIVPPLTTDNYKIKTFATGTFNLSDSESTTFETMSILDGENASNGAINFGDGGTDDETDISYIPYYSESHRNMRGYFELNIGSSFSNTLAFRVADLNIITGTPVLKDYNYGWTSLKTERLTGSVNTKPIYQVLVPFDLPGYINTNHRIAVQIASHPGSDTSDLELSSAYLYYYTS